MVLLYLATADTPAEFGMVLSAFRKEYFAQFPGVRPELKEKYMYEPMGRAEGQLRAEWKEQQRIKLEEEKTGYINSELSAAVATKDPSTLANEVLALQASEAGSYKNGIKGVNDNIKKALESMDLTDQQIDGLFDQIIPTGPHKGKQWGSVYGRIFGGRDALKQTMNNRANNRVQRSLDEQNRKSEAFRANILKDRANGIWHKPEDLMRLAEEQNINLTTNLKSTILKEPISDETARLEADRLISDRGGDDGGFLTRAEYDLLPPSIRDEYKDNLIDAPEAAENKKKTELITDQLKGFVLRATRSEEGPDGKLTDPDAGLILENANDFLLTDT